MLQVADAAWASTMRVCELHNIVKRDHNSFVYSKTSCDAFLQCDAGIGTNALYEQLYRNPTKILVLGAGCSGVSEATAQVSHLWNLVQVSSYMVIVPRSCFYQTVSNSSSKSIFSDSFAGFCGQNRSAHVCDSKLYSLNCKQTFTQNMHIAN